MVRSNLELLNTSYILLNIRERGRRKHNRTMHSRENVKTVTMNLLPLLPLNDIMARYRAKYPK
jgi:hypothetical protein